MLVRCVLQVYSGLYKNPRTLATRVNIVENLLQALRENVFVAINIQGYKNLPVIGKVRSVNAEAPTLRLM